MPASYVPSTTYAPSPSSQSGTAVSGTTVGDTTIASLWTRHEALKTVEADKNNLIEEILFRYEFLSDQLKKECEDLDREREYNRQSQRSIKDLEDRIRRMKAFMERDPFILVLIDGDGMIFQDNLLQEGENGGRKAAHILHTEVSEYIQSIESGLPSDVKIVTRIYATIKGLAETCIRAGIVDKISAVEEFVRGFTRGKNLFDFVDVGPGKDRADDKLTETFKLYLYDFHCLHILFGCSHDNGYARLLEEYTTDQGFVSRITLLEGVPFEKELVTLPFMTKKFENLFRSSKINLYGNQSQITPFAPPGLGTTPLYGNPISNQAFPLLPTKEPSTPTLTTSWAAALAKPGPSPSLTPAAPLKAAAASTLAPTPTTILHNRKGQRIDPAVRNYDKEEVSRVKRLKMCNVHFLRRDCLFGTACTHRHDYKPTATELETLRLVARMAPCDYGSACQDVKCIYGHVCPAPDKKGTKGCIFGETCKFPAELHGVDMEVVRFTKV
ncbi:hypothetical protein H2201_006804 [Coniosporium apollinis]|uniref:C3H1-type domain-containing protein n=1 Tax=Coniosporium apollinis TaxID=61459 RepID=A0ABQ9NKT5_9PEZI|nr:hypothetical protein H2201_006804 [Coniosporium apollinis]